MTSQNNKSCAAVQFSDQMACACGNVWDMNDPDPPECRKNNNQKTNQNNTCTYSRKPYTCLTKSTKTDR